MGKTSIFRKSPTTCEYAWTAAGKLSHADSRSTATSRGRSINRDILAGRGVQSRPRRHRLLPGRPQCSWGVQRFRACLGLYLDDTGKDVPQLEAPNPQSACATGELLAGSHWRWSGWSRQDWRVPRHARIPSALMPVAGAVQPLRWSRPSRPWLHRGGC